MPGQNTALLLFTGSFAYLCKYADITRSRPFSAGNVLFLEMAMSMPLIRPGDLTDLLH